MYSSETVHTKVTTEEEYDTAVNEFAKGYTYDPYVSYPKDELVAMKLRDERMIREGYLRARAEDFDRDFDVDKRFFELRNFELYGNRLPQQA